MKSRIYKALATCSRLKAFKYKTKCSYKWKLHVYQAIIVAQVTYGLSTVQLTLAMLSRLDPFQMRGLRCVLELFRGIQQ